jgi:hypothetical protein
MIIMMCKLYYFVFFFQPNGCWKYKCLRIIIFDIKNIIIISIYYMKIYFYMNQQKFYFYSEMGYTQVQFNAGEIKMSVDITNKAKCFYFCLANVLFEGKINIKKHFEISLRPIYSSFLIYELSVRRQFTTQYSSCTIQRGTIHRRNHIHHEKIKIPLD